MRMLITLFSLVCITSLPSQAAKLPSVGNAHEKVCQTFLSQSGMSVGGSSTILCSCLVNEIQSKLSTNEMRAYQASSSGGKALSPALQQKVTQIASACLIKAMN